MNEELIKEWVLKAEEDYLTVEELIRYMSGNLLQ